MQKTPKKPDPTSSMETYALIFVFIVLLDLAGLFFITTQVKTMALLRDQQQQLQQDLKIVNSSEQIYERYKNNIQLILDVFPGEKQVLEVLQTLEVVAKSESDESAVRFASLSPQPEGDSLFLLFTISLTTDETRLAAFLDKIESLPYMTRLLSLSINYSDTQKGIIRVTTELKLYVQNPFSSN